MEDMNFTELIIVVKGLGYAEAEAWNRTRHMMLAILSPYMKRKLKVTELYPLIIDEDYEEKEELTTEIDNADVEWYKNFVNNYKKEEN